MNGYDLDTEINNLREELKLAISGNTKNQLENKEQIEDIKKSMQEFNGNKSEHLVHDKECLDKITVLKNKIRHEASNVFNQLKDKINEQEEVNSHPKIDNLWNICEMRNSGSGYFDVISIFYDFVPLLKK